MGRTRKKESFHLLKLLYRKELKEKIKSLSAKKRQQKSFKICSRVLKSREFLKARKVLLYSSIRDEVATQRLVKETLQLGKQVYLPRVNSKLRTVSLYEVKNLKKDLIKGFQGIREPRAISHRKQSFRQIDLVIVPGLGFTRKGVRLGRGGGYYDRLLKKSRNVYKLGIAYREQICRKLPRTKLDVSVNKVITD